MPKSYMFFVPCFIAVLLVYMYFMNKKAKSIRESIDPEKLYKDFVKNNFGEYQNMDLIAAKLSEEGKDVAKHLGKLAAKKFAWGAIGFRYRETDNSPDMLLVAFDDQKTVFIPVSAGLFSGGITTFNDLKPIEIQDGDIKELKMSEGSDMVVFIPSVGDKMVIKVAEKDFFGKDQSEKKSSFMQKVRRLKERTSM